MEPVTLNGAVPFKNSDGLLIISVKSACESNRPTCAPGSFGTISCNINLDKAFPARTSSVMNTLHSVLLRWAVQ